MVNPIIANAGNYNLLGKMAAGQQIGQRMRQERRMNALAGVIGSEGLDSPKAQNLLAQLEPMAVSQMRQQESQFGRTMEQRDSQFGETMGLRREEMAFSQQMQRAQLNLARAAAARAGANSQAALAAARRKEGAAILQTVMNLPPERQQQAYSMAVGMLAEYGMDPSSLPEEFSPEWAGLAVAQLSGAAPESRPGFRPATHEEAGQYGAVGGQFGPDGRFYPVNPPSRMSVEVGPDGQVRLAQGPGASVKPFTEGQSKDNVYVVRARGALDALEGIGAEELTSFGQRAANIDPTGFVRGAVQTDKFQIAQQASEEFLQAILRKDTGAAITAQEQEIYGKTYMPQPGDNAAVLAEKSRARRRAINAIEAGMSPAQMIAVERGLAASESEGSGGGASSGEYTGPSAEQVRAMTPEQAAAVDLTTAPMDIVDAVTEVMSK